MDTNFRINRWQSILNYSERSSDIGFLDNLVFSTFSVEQINSNLEQIARLCDLSYEYGHSNGRSEVEYYFEEMASLIR